MTVFLKGRARSVWGVGLLACVLVVGCSGDEPAPTFTPRAVSSSPSPDVAGSEEPTPGAEQEELVAPSLPEEITDFNIDGAEATARYYLAAFSYGYASNDSEPLQQISGSDCGTCTKHIAAINDLKAQNMSYEGGAIHYEDPIESSEIDDEALMVFEVIQDASSMVDANGMTVDSGSGVTVRMEILLRFESEQWTVRAVAGEVIE